jgi:hypothetical protein
MRKELRIVRAKRTTPAILRVFGVATVDEPVLQLALELTLSDFSVHSCSLCSWRWARDPMLGSADSWKLIMEDASNTVNQTEPGIFDVRSGSDKNSSERTPYSEW